MAGVGTSQAISRTPAPEAVELPLVYIGMRFLNLRRVVRE